MLRKMILGAVAAAAIGFGTQAATAGEPVSVPVAGANVGFHRIGPCRGISPGPLRAL